MNIIIALVKSPLFRGALLALVVVIAGYTLISGYGKAEYERGFRDAENAQLRAEAEKTSALVKSLADAQQQGFIALKNEAGIAKKNQEAALVRSAQLLDGLEDLTHVTEVDCLRVNTDTVRLLNAAACTYNTQRGFAKSGDPGGVCR